MEEFNVHLAAMRRSGDAADCLIAFLKKHRWQGVQRGHQDEGELPMGTLRIRIGTKSEPELPRSSRLEMDEQREQYLMDHGMVDDTRPVPLQREQQRSISKEQRDIVVEMLSSVRQRYNKVDWKMVPVEIRCPAGNDEAHRYAEQIAELLNDSGWELVGGKVVIDANFKRKLRGIVIREDSGAVAQHLFQGGDLLKSLQKAGIESRDMTERTFDPLQILVGW